MNLTCWLRRIGTSKTPQHRTTVARLSGKKAQTENFSFIYNGFKNKYFLMFEICLKLKFNNHKLQFPSSKSIFIHTTIPLKNFYTQFIISCLLASLTAMDKRPWQHTPLNCPKHPPINPLTFSRKVITAINVDPTERMSKPLKTNVLQCWAFTWGTSPGNAFWSMQRV